MVGVGCGHHQRSRDGSVVIWDGYDLRMDGTRERRMIDAAKDAAMTHQT